MFDKNTPVFLEPSQVSDANLGMVSIRQSGNRLNRVRLCPKSPQQKSQQSWNEYFARCGCLGCGRKTGRSHNGFCSACELVVRRHTSVLLKIIKRR
jgi:hypothetical protein